MKRWPYAATIREDSLTGWYRIETPRGEILVPGDIARAALQDGKLARLDAFLRSEMYRQHPLTAEETFLDALEWAGWL